MSFYTLLNNIIQYIYILFRSI